MLLRKVIFLFIIFLLTPLSVIAEKGITIKENLINFDLKFMVKLKSNNFIVDKDSQLIQVIDDNQKKHVVGGYTAKLGKNSKNPSIRCFGKNNQEDFIIWSGYNFCNMKTPTKSEIINDNNKMEFTTNEGLKFNVIVQSRKTFKITVKGEIEKPEDFYVNPGNSDFDHYPTKILGTIKPTLGNPELYHEDKLIEFRENFVLFENDKIVTKDKSEAEVRYKAMHFFRILENTTAVFKSYNVLLKIGKARFQFQRINKEFKIITPVVLVGIHGTELTIDHNNEVGSTIKLHKGSGFITPLIGKKSIFNLEEGKTIIVDLAGNIKRISEKPPIYLQLVSNSSKIRNDIVTHGKGAIFISSYYKGAKDVKFPIDVTLNGKNFNNGKKMYFEDAKLIRLKNLKIQPYNVEISCSGFSFTQEAIFLSDKKSKDIKISFVVYAIEILIPEIIYYPDDLLSMISIELNGRRKNLKVVGKNGESQYPTTGYNREKALLYLCLPSSNDKYKLKILWKNGHLIREVSLHEGMIE